MKTKSEIWTNSSGKRFVVLPEDDFARLTELIEDAGLSRILLEAKAADQGEPGIPFAQVKRQLAAHRRTAAKRRKSDAPARRNPVKWKTMAASNYDDLSNEEQC